MLEESWSKFATYSKRQQKAYLSYRRVCLHFLKGKPWAGIPLSFHLADITPGFVLFYFISFYLISFHFCDLYTISLCVQKYSPGSEVPPHSAPFLPRGWDASAWRCTQVNQWCWQAASLRSRLFHKAPFSSVSVMMPTLRAFSFDYSPQLRLTGKTLPSFGSTSQPCLSSSWAHCCEQPRLNLHVPPKRSWLMSLPQKTDSSDFKCINVSKAARFHRSDTQPHGVVPVSAACVCHLPECRTDGQNWCLVKRVFVITQRVP